MSDARKIVIVGCGHRPQSVPRWRPANQDKTAEVLMLSDENCEPMRNRRCRSGAHAR